MSSYGWTNEATKEGKPRAPKVPEGQTELEVIDVIFGKKGQPFRSGKGDPQIMLIFSDGKGNEASQMYTLSEKAGFTLAKMLAAAGCNLQKLEASGKTPQDFADQRFGTAQLKGRRFMADVTHDGDQYFIIEPLRPEPAGVSDSNQNEDEIPI